MYGQARRTVLAVCVVLAVLLVAAPSPSTAVALLAQPGTASDPTGPLVAAVALAAWVLSLWLAGVALLVLVARAPGVLGRAASAVGRRTAPAAVRRTLELALGVTVTVGVLSVPATAALGPVAAAAPAGPTGAPLLALPSLDWPDLRTSSAVPTPVGPPPAQTTEPTAASPSAAEARAGSTPPGGAPPDPAPPDPAPPDPAPPDPAPPDPAPPGDAPPGPAPTGTAPTYSTTAAAVVVRPGDSLWALAEAHLERTGVAAPTDRQVAEAWPQWWSANRPTIGDDPDVIHPGAVLRPPLP